MRVQTYTFGCKVNRADTVAMERILARQEGVELVRQGVSPDVVVVNTCTVTEQADRQARQLLRRVHRRFPSARIVVTGCYAQDRPAEVSSLPGVGHVLPMAEQKSLPRLLGLAGEDEEATAALPVEKIPGQTRAFLKVQDGCNAYCSFCILPYVRGRSRSLPPEDLVAQAKGLQESGHRELVLTGTHMGAYGRDLSPRLRFSDLVRRLSEAIPGLAIRVSSIEPTTLTPDLIRAVTDTGELRPHFHIPLQSGSDSVLRRMNRKYRARHFEERIERLAKVREKVAIGTDVIVGFPGETDAEFEETYSLLECSPVTFFHVFPFSPRPGTRAASLLDDVPWPVKKERSRRLRELGDRKRQAFVASFLGTVVPVLVESKRDARGRLSGHTPHYFPVCFAGADRLIGREVDVLLEADEGDVVAGRVV